MYYEKKVISLNSFIKVVIELNNKFYRLTIEIYSSNLNNKIKFQKKYANFITNNNKLINNLVLVIKLH